MQNHSIANVRSKAEGERLKKALINQLTQNVFGMGKQDEMREAIRLVRNSIRHVFWCEVQISPEDCVKFGTTFDFCCGFVRGLIVMESRMKREARKAKGSKKPAKRRA